MKSQDDKVIGELSEQEIGGDRQNCRILPKKLQGALKN